MVVEQGDVDADLDQSDADEQVWQPGGLVPSPAATSATHPRRTATVTGSGAGPPGCDMGQHGQSDAGHRERGDPEPAEPVWAVRVRLGALL